jgi:predicted TIM-barrel enzyme
LAIYTRYGVDSIILENDHDLPYQRPPLPEDAIELMTDIAKRVRGEFDGPIGIQMLEAANEASMEIAHNANLDFIRAEGYVFAHVGTSGIIEGCAAQLLRKRKELNAENIKVFADV